MGGGHKCYIYLSIINYMSSVVQNMSPLYCWDDSYIDSSIQRRRNEMTRD